MKQSWQAHKQSPDEEFHTRPTLIRALQSGDKVEYSVIHVGVKMVDSRLAFALGIKQ